MFFQEALVNIFVFPVIYSHGTASGVRFIKPCQFAAASQRYRFCSWNGLVPPQQGKIIQNAERPPSSRNSGRSGRLACGGLGNGAPGSRSPGYGGVKGTGGRRLQVTPRCSPHGSVGCRQAHGPRGTRMLLVLCIPSLRPVPTPSSLGSGDCQPEQRRSSHSKWSPGQERMQSTQLPPPPAP